ncbi:hypothetical protein ACU8KH_02634 [Lachancea thermotolerans]
MANKREIAELVVFNYVSEHEDSATADIVCFWLCCASLSAASSQGVRAVRIR